MFGLGNKSVDGILSTFVKAKDDLITLQATKREDISDKLQEIDNIRDALSLDRIEADRAGAIARKISDFLVS